MTVAPAPHLRRAGLAITIVSLTAIAFATLLPGPPAAPGSHLCLACGSFGGVNAILNVLLFVPLGVGLALSGYPGTRTVLIVFALSAMIELTQLAIPGRYSTIGDVLTNTIGGAIGFAASRYAWVWLLPSPRIATSFFIGWCAIWLTVQAASGFAFTPSVPDSRYYYGQLARKLGHFAVFRGRVRGASIDGVSITDTRLNDADSVGRLLRGGSTVAVTVISGELTNDIAPIVRVADAEEREIALLAQDSQKLLFGIRTGAAILRLRPPLFAVAGVFPSSIANGNHSSADTISLSGSYNVREAQLTARTGSARKYRGLPVSASLGWTLVLPFQWLIEDTRAELFVSWIWMAGLMVPLGYWGARIARISDWQANPALALVCFLGGIAILIVGLVLVPDAFGLPAAPTREWLAAATGVLVGGALVLCTREFGGSAKLTPRSREGLQQESRFPGR